MLVFVEYPEKKFRSKGENQQQTKPTYGVIYRIWSFLETIMVKIEI